MTDMTNVEEILEYAIEMEQAAIDLYTKIAMKAGSDQVKKIFLSLADEERGHKARLEGVKAGKRVIGSKEKIMDMKILDYTNDIELSDDPSYQDILLFAMKQEKQAFRLYTDLANRTDDVDIKELFLSLAQEEAKHKLHFEIEYDERILTEN